jgi:heme exporter protein C
MKRRKAVSLKRWLVVACGVLGVAMTLVLHWQVFFWVPTERTMGVVQRIFYVHVPSAWVAFLAFGVVALCSAVYLWLGDERADSAAVSAAEGGMVFTTAVLITGPLWGKVAWGTWWEWEPRLILTLLLWFIYLGYFMVRGASDNVERGRRLSAVVGIVGAVTLPINHMSVRWWRSLHPEPVVMNPTGATLDGDMWLTVFTGFFAFLLLYTAIFALRYALERAAHATAAPAGGAA